MPREIEIKDLDKSIYTFTGVEYLGITDIHGNEICEDDIVQGYLNGRKFIGRIVYDKNEAAFQIQGLHQSYYLWELIDIEIINKLEKWMELL